MFSEAVTHRVPRRLVGIKKNLFDGASETDKKKRQMVRHISPVARAVIDRIMAERPGIRRAFIFPSPSDPAKPVSKELVYDWLSKAEELAGLPKLDGGMWHPYRRKWATERKHLPDKDVAAAGGWERTESLKKSYQQVDPATMLLVVITRHELPRPSDPHAHLHAQLRKAPVAEVPQVV